ncbi:MAG: hypothetical protein ACLFST_02260 [Spirochaetia bacterium]
MPSLETERFKLVITETTAGEYNYQLSDKENGRIFSDYDYFYGILISGNNTDPEEIAFPEEIDVETIRKLLTPETPIHLESRTMSQEEKSLRISGQFSNGLGFIHTFSSEGSYLTETISLTNGTDKTVSPLKINFGFRKMLFTKKTGWQEDMDTWRLESLPLRRYCSQRLDRRLNSYTASDLLYAPFDDGDVNLKPGFGAEGWIWGTPETNMLIWKYNPDEIEFSRFCRFPEILPGRGQENTAVIFGGAAQYKQDPEFSMSLLPGQTYTFGKTRYTFFSGSYEDGAGIYRNFLEQQGHAIPEDYDPKMHWNELYNLGWFAEVAGYFTEGTEFKLYTRDELFREAELAKAAGAECLYLDPGWDTEPGSTVWDNNRLGPFRDFARTIHAEYGLKLALHLMMNFWSAREKETFYWRDRNGNKQRNPDDGLLFRFCANDDWVETKSTRLLKLAEEGADFFMFDFTAYGMDALGCHSHDHGHEVPMLRQTHADNLFRVIQNIKRKYPHVVIEAHDRIRGGLNDYHPYYFQENKDHSFDELWGFEYMWNPLQDLLSGKALSLYEYNLSYSVPLYLHINSSCDNDSMLQFWWYASTVRHLGIGGIADPEDPAFQRLRKAVTLYKKHNLFFIHGTFRGIDPLTHLHTDPGSGNCLLTAFNLSSTKERKKIVFKPEKYGLKPGLSSIACWNGTGIKQKAELVMDGGKVNLSIEVPPLSPVICLLS